MIELPEPGEGRSWRLTADAKLELWHGEAPTVDCVGSFSDGWAVPYVISSEFVHSDNPVKLRRAAERMVRMADEAGVYTYENGKLVKK